MPVGRPLHLRLFLEGEEVPVIAAQVSVGMNAPAAASVQVVPLDEALVLKPRTMVHLFFLDSYDSRVPTNQAGTRKEEDRLNIPFLDNYKLLFSGEIVGFQFVKTPNSRAVVLQCLDFSSYWDTAHATAIEYGPNGNAFTDQGALRASNTGLFDDIVNTTSDMLVQWIRQKPLTPGLTNISGLAGGVIRVLEMIGGVPQHHRGVNDFFTIAQLRCRVLEQIVAEENDTTAADLLKVVVFDEWIRNGLQNAGQQISFRDMLKLLFAYIHYDVVPNPAAKFDPTFQGTTSPRIVTEELFKHPQAKKALADIAVIETSLAGYVSTTDTDALAGVSRNYKSQIKDVDSGLATLQAAQKALASDVSKARSSLTKAMNILSANSTPKDSSFIGDVIKALDQAVSTIKNSKAVVSQQQGMTTTGSTQRLRSQIIRPDCFFSPPPRCNVLFPEQYTQLSYDRQFLAEVTRSLVLGYNTLVGKDALLADRILAPSVGIDTDLLATKPGKEGYRALMKHELHTGIIPRSEWLPNTQSFSSSKTDSNKKSYTDDRTSWARKIALFHFFKYRFGPRQASVGGRFNPYVVCGFPAVIIVKPFIIPGISQAPNGTDQQVIDTVLGQSQSTTASPLAPSQLVGMIISLSHSIDQNGGTTSIGMSHVRQHLGIDDEFLGVLLAATTTQKQRIRIHLSAADVAISAKQSLKSILIGVTPQVSPTSPSASSTRSLSKKTAQVPKTSIDPTTKRKVTTTGTSTFQVIQEGDSTVPNTVPPLTAKGRIDKITRDLLVPYPSAKLSAGGKGVFGTIIGVEVIDASISQLQGSQVYSDVILYEEVTVPVSSTTPVEEIIRPKWFSNSYSNASIGKNIYQPFFGVPSIIDEADFSGLGATAVSSTTASSTEGSTQDPDANLAQVVQDLSSQANSVAQLSIERAVNFISYIYGLVRVKGLDVDDFIRQYANRPIATLPQMLGDPDLDFTLDAQGVASVKQVTDSNGNLRTPRIGFHSLAVHPTVVDAGNLSGLLVEPDLQSQRINGSGKSQAIPPEYDVRKAKKDRVRAYIAALGTGPGFRG